MGTLDGPDGSDWPGGSDWRGGSDWCGGSDGSGDPIGVAGAGEDGEPCGVAFVGAVEVGLACGLAGGLVEVLLLDVGLAEPSGAEGAVVALAEGASTRAPAAVAAARAAATRRAERWLRPAGCTAHPSVDHAECRYRSVQ